MSTNIPLCIDLDGTLIHSDVTVESFILLIKKNPLYVFICIIWLAHKGMAYFKHQIALRVHPDPALLPYNQPFLDYLQHEKQQNRQLLLITASNERIAHQVAAHLGIFSQVIASTATDNVKGARKRELLNQHFGDKCYDYAGNSRDDLAIWPYARKAIVVNASATVIDQAKKTADIAQIFSTTHNRFIALLSVLRIHQYAKNLLVFVPLITGHLYTNITAIGYSLLAFVIFCCLASSAYLLNDLLDIEADRQHSSKYLRSFARADISLTLGLIGSPLLLLIACCLALPFSTAFFICLASYYALTTLYSFYLKRWVFIDILALSILYTLRILAGIAATHTDYSLWLISFAVCLFLSLGAVKRYTELQLAVTEFKTAVIGRGYQLTDLTKLYRLGIIFGYISVLVFICYINSTKVTALYYHPNWLWCIAAILLFWITRVWRLARQARLHNDPVTFAIHDKTSWCLLLFVGIIIAIATH